MKIQNILMIGILGMSTLLSCQDDEVLNLENFPVNQPDIFVQDADKLSAKLLATYQGDGSLALNGALSRTYVYRFKASPEELRVNFTPISTNIPSDKVQLSTTSVVLAPGETDALVTVSLVGDDFSFATSNYKAETYELGVAALAEGYNVMSEPKEQKLVIEKEAYQVHASFIGDNNNRVSFTRTLADGTIQDEEPMSYSFTVELDKPAQKDIVVSILTEGLVEKFQNTVTVTPAEIVIPAGQKSSQKITWTLGNDFLLEDAEPAIYDLALKLKVQSEDETVQTESSNQVDVKVIKRVVNVGLVDKIVNTWTEVNKADCSVLSVSGIKGDKSKLLDGEGGKGASYLYAYYWDLPGIASFDLKTERVVKGIKLDYAYYYGAYTAPQDLTVYTSDDGQTWVEQANLVQMPIQETHILRFYKEVKTRYIKVQFNQITDWMLGFSEFTAFE